MQVTLDRSLFKLKIKPGNEKEYIARHQAVWPASVPCGGVALPFSLFTLLLTASVATSQSPLLHHNASRWVAGMPNCPGFIERLCMTHVVHLAVLWQAVRRDLAAAGVETMNIWMEGSTIFLLMECRNFKAATSG